MNVKFLNSVAGRGSMQSVLSRSQRAAGLIKAPSKIKTKQHSTFHSCDVNKIMKEKKKQLFLCSTLFEYDHWKVIRYYSLQKKYSKQEVMFYSR